MTVILKRRASARIVLEWKVAPVAATETTPEVEGVPAVSLTVRPAGEADIDLARGAAGRHIAAIVAGNEAITRYGLPPLDADLTTSEGVQAALRVGEAIMAIEMGIRHVISWEGVTLDGETPAPLDHANLALLLNERGSDGLSYGHKFLRGIQAVPTLETDAKNVFAVSPAGSAGEAGIIAAAVLLSQPAAPPAAPSSMTAS